MGSSCFSTTVVATKPSSSEVLRGLGGTDYQLQVCGPTLPTSEFVLKMCQPKTTFLFFLFVFPSCTGQQVDQSEPVYLGKFEQTTHSVAGDIFVLDEKTIYIQDFAHDGQAPDVFFWADGVIIPYITRSNLEPQVGLKRFLPREDIVLLLPEEKPSVFDIRKLEVWCRAFGVSFGQINLPDFVRK